MNNPSSSPKNLQFDEDWSAHPAIEWLSTHKNILLWALIGLIAFLIIASQLINWRTLNAEKDFFQAQTTFNQFQQAATQPQENSMATVDFEQLEAIMQRHPELKPKYEGALAQTFLINGQIPQAQAFIEDIFKRTTPDHLQLYQSYTQTSLLIGQKQYAEGLQQALRLKTTLDQLGEEANPILYVFNLIRIAALYQQTGQIQEELNIWDQLQNQMKRSEALLVANEAFIVGHASLHQYIKERKDALTSGK